MKFLKKLLEGIAPKKDATVNSPTIAKILKPDGDNETILNKYRNRYAYNLIGKWRSYQDGKKGAGFDGLGVFGNTLTFNADGSGTVHNWGTDETENFHWKSLGIRRIYIDIEDSEEKNADEAPEDVVADSFEYDFYVDDYSGLVLLKSIEAGSADFFDVFVGPLLLIDDDNT